MPPPAALLAPHPFWGVNVHFNRASTPQSEFEQVGEAFRVARVDFSWQSVEQTAGVYDFSNYDALHSSFAASITPATPQLTLAVCLAAGASSGSSRALPS